MNILGIDNIVIDVTDLEQARHFYGTSLGLAEQYAFPDRGIIGYRIGYEEPGFVIRANPEHQPAEQRGPRVWLEVEDARKTAEHLSTRGIAPLGPATRVNSGWVVEFTDPFGNVIGLVDYTAAPELGRPASG